MAAVSTTAEREPLFPFNPSRIPRPALPLATSGRELRFLTQAPPPPRGIVADNRDGDADLASGQRMRLEPGRTHVRPGPNALRLLAERSIVGRTALDGYQRRPQLKSRNVMPQRVPSAVAPALERRLPQRRNVPADGPEFEANPRQGSVRRRQHGPQLFRPR